MLLSYSAKMTEMYQRKEKPSKHVNSLERCILAWKGFSRHTGADDNDATLLRHCDATGSHDVIALLPVTRTCVIMRCRKTVCEMRAKRHGTMVSRAFARGCSIRGLGG